MPYKMHHCVATLLILALFPINVLMVGVSYAGKLSKVESFEDKHRVKKGEFQYVVDLNSGLCTGTLIASQWVLTAGHCVESETIKVAFGSNRDENLYETEGTTIVHPYFHVYPDEYVDESTENTNEEANRNSRSGNKKIDKYAKYTKKEKNDDDEEEETEEEETHDYKYDIALIKLEEPVERISPINLPKSNAIPPQENETAINVGWGKYRRFEQNGVFLQTYTEDHPTVLRQVNLTLRSPYVCLNWYDHDMDRRICAGSSTENSCPGDSGSPLIVNGIQWGIDSYGETSIETMVHEWNREKMEIRFKTYCGAGPDIYLSIWHYVDWINCVKKFEETHGAKFVGLYCAILHP